MLCYFRFDYIFYLMDQVFKKLIFMLLLFYNIVYLIIRIYIILKVIR